MERVTKLEWVKEKSFQPACQYPVGSTSKKSFQKNIYLSNNESHNLRESYTDALD
jgi:hypothetical protein